MRWGVGVDAHEIMGKTGIGLNPSGSWATRQNCPKSRRRASQEWLHDESLATRMAGFGSAIRAVAFGFAAVVRNKFTVASPAPIPRAWKARGWRSVCLSAGMNSGTTFKVPEKRGRWVKTSAFPANHSAVPHFGPLDAVIVTVFLCVIGGLLYLLAQN